MKKNKKTWGILGTSMGSMLIIVALLAMVGMGSNDTYATGQCSCPATYTWIPNTTDCTKTENGITKTTTCSCSGNTKLDSSGTCIPKETTTGGDDNDDKPSDPKPPTGGDNDDDKPSSTPSAKCEPGTYYDGNYGCLTCTEGFYCPGGTFSHSTADINGSGRRKCPETATSCTSTGFTCSGIYTKNTAGTDCVEKETSDSSTCSKANESCTLNGKSGTCKANTSGTGFTCQVPNAPTGGDDKPSNPNTPTGGGNDGSGGNGGGNSGGNSGGNGNGGNTGGNNGNNNGGNNTTKNPNTATKAPLVIAIIGIISVGISSVVYFNGKKEINTEI